MSLLFDRIKILPTIVYAELKKYFTSYELLCFELDLPREVFDILIELNSRKYISPAYSKFLQKHNLTLAEEPKCFLSGDHAKYKIYNDKKIQAYDSIIITCKNCNQRYKTTIEERADPRFYNFENPCYCTSPIHQSKKSKIAWDNIKVVCYQCNRCFVIDKKNYDLYECRYYH